MIAAFKINSLWDTSQGKAAFGKKVMLKAQLTRDGNKLKPKIVYLIFSIRA